MSIKILNPGVQSLVQDGGRFGMARCGVPVSGAFDRGSWQLANELVGNDVPGPFDTWSGPASIEVLLGGLRIEATDDLVIAVTGASVAVTLLDVDDDDKHDMELNEPIELTAGSRLHLGTARVGLRAYVGVAGGIDVDPTLGSRSTDTTSDLGPHVLAKGDVLKVGWASGQPRAAPHRSTGLPNGTGPAVVQFRPRPEFEPTTSGAGWQDLLTSTTWLVSPASSRAGVRLTPETTGNALMPTSATLPSSATLPGAVQALPDGELAVIGPDGPTTGGYPVVAVIDRPELDLIAQARPGTRLRLRSQGD